MILSACDIFARHFCATVAAQARLAVGVDDGGPGCARRAAASSAAVQRGGQRHDPSAPAGAFAFLLSTRPECTISLTPASLRLCSAVRLFSPPLTCAAARPRAPFGQAGGGSMPMMMMGGAEFAGWFELAGKGAGIQVIRLLCAISSVLWPSLLYMETQALARGDPWQVAG